MDCMLLIFNRCLRKAQNMTGSRQNETPEPPDCDSILELLGDEYAREIVDALAAGAATATELVDCCDGSDVTIYRRLNCLEDAGVVRSTPKLSPDGNHCSRYELVLERMTVSLTDDGVVIEVDAQDGTDRRESLRAIE